MNVFEIGGERSEGEHGGSQYTLYTWMTLLKKIVMDKNITWGEYYIIVLHLGVKQQKFFDCVKQKLKCKSSYKQGIVAHDFNPSISEAEAGGSLWVWATGLKGKFQDS